MPGKNELSLRAEAPALLLLSQKLPGQGSPSGRRCSPGLLAPARESGGRNRPVLHGSHLQGPGGTPPQRLKHLGCWAEVEKN